MRMKRLSKSEFIYFIYKTTKSLLPRILLSHILYIPAPYFDFLSKRTVETAARPLVRYKKNSNQNTNAMSDFNLPNSSELLTKIDDISKTLHKHFDDFDKIQALVRERIRAEGTVDHAWNEVREPRSPIRRRDKHTH